MLNSSRSLADHHLANKLSAPRANWLFGHLFQFAQDPLAFLDHCARNYGDIVPLQLGPDHWVLLNHPDCIEEAFVRQNRVFMRKGRLFRQATKPLLGNGLFMSEGKFYQRQRELVQPAFHKQMITTYAEVMATETNTTISQWQNHQNRDVYQDYVDITRSIISKTMLGVGLDAEAAAAVTRALDVTIQHFKAHIDHPLHIPDWFPTPHNLRLHGALRQLDQVIEQILEQRRSSREDQANFLDLLLQAQAEGEGMTQQQLRDETINIFLAGHETTAIALTWTSWLLAQHPTVEAQLVEELQTVLQGRTPTLADLPQLRYTEAVVLETLRLYPPVWALGRVALEDTEVAGYMIPKGTNVLASQWSAHRNPQYFPEPEVFNPSRWMNNLAKEVPLGAYFPFSLGGRICLGKAFGMMELVLLLATIAQKFQLTLAPNCRVELLPSLTLRPKYGMQMIVTSR
jgi:cytochrome P450